MGVYLSTSSDVSELAAYCKYFCQNQRKAYRDRMTYCLGWKSQNSVFIVADTALTTEAYKPTGPFVSSFGEVNYSSKDTYVREALLKICVVGKIIIGFAGNVNTAFEIIAVFKQLISSNSSVHEVLEKAIRSCGPYSKKNDVELIVGYVDKNGPRLISYNHDEERSIHEHDQFVQVGSIASYYPALSEATIKMFLKGKLPDENMLAAITAILQNYGILDRLMKMKVGGVFFGISVNATGVSWQEDTSYFLYPPDLRSLQHISVVARDNVLSVSSSLSGDKRVFMNTINTTNPEKWQARWIPRLKRKFNSGQSIFYTFLSKRDRLITVIKAPNPLSNKYFKIHADGMGKFDLFFSPELMAMLKNPNVVEKGISLPFRFNWISA